MTAAEQPVRPGSGPVLVTGSRGPLGTWVVAELAYRGYSVREFDATLGGDLMDIGGLSAAVRGCAAVIHLADLPNDDPGPSEATMCINALGTWHLLEASRRSRVPRVITMSSAAATGCFEDGVMPDQLPVDDRHDARPLTPYALSKRFGEQMCHSLTATAGIVTVALRATTIAGPDDREEAGARFAEAVGSGTTSVDFGAWVDARDVARAIRLALTAAVGGHLTCLLSDDELVMAWDPLDLARRVYSEVPRRSLLGGLPLVRSDLAHSVLGWQPRWDWLGQARFDD